MKLQRAINLERSLGVLGRPARRSGVRARRGAAGAGTPGAWLAGKQTALIF